MKPIHIHFVCTGNVYRSRLAEAYLRSKKLPNVLVSSSGIKAAENRHGPIAWFALRLVQNHNLTPHLTTMWAQTSAKTLNKADIVIFMTDEHHKYSKAKFDFGKTSYEIWNILDLHDAGFTDAQIKLTSEMKRMKYTEKVFAEIKKKVDGLVARLKKN